MRVVSWGFPGERLKVQPHSKFGKPSLAWQTCMRNRGTYKVFEHTANPRLLIYYDRKKGIVQMLISKISSMMFQQGDYKEKKALNKISL